MRPVHCAVLLSAALALPVLAKLPAPSDEAKAAAAETANKASWNDKVAAYKLCQSQDKIAAAFKKTAKEPAAVQTAAAASGAAPAPVAAIPGCTDPGPYVALTPAASKPLEASGAHSPPGTAVSPPSNNATSAQMTPAPKSK